ncbi:MFS transporter [Microbacterium sp.]|uniref:MFS transporter n=1 Tax=Microbacterium sp. TaxID=51671 RepID=UPI0037C75373
MSAEAPARTSVWRAPGFRRLASAWVFTNLADSALFLMAAVWVKELTGSDVAGAFVFVALGLPAVLAPFLGMLADRLPRKRLLVASNLVLVPVILTLLLVGSAESVWIVYAAIFVYSSCGYLTGAAQSGIIRSMLSDDQLAPGNGILSTIDNALRLVSPLIGTALYVWIGPQAVVALTAGCFAVAAAILTALPVGSTAPERGETVRSGVRGYLRELGAGFEHLYRVRPLRMLTIAIAIAFGATGILNIAVFAVLDAMSVDPAVLGLLMPLQGIGAVVGGLLSGFIVTRMGEARAAALGMLLVAVGTVPLLGTSVWFAGAGMVVMGLGIPIVVVAFVTLRQRATPDELQGRASAAGNVMFNLPQTAISIVGAGLLVAIDYRVLLAVTIAAVLAGGVIALIGRRAPEVPGAD